jgi:hypothetical protein
MANGETFVLQRKKLMPLTEGYRISFPRRCLSPLAVDFILFTHLFIHIIYL